MGAANDNHYYSPVAGIFNSQMARQGYALNKMCFSLNQEENRRRFKAFPEAYCLKYGLSRAQISAVTDLDVMAMLQLGGNIVYLQKLTRVYGLDLYELDAVQNAHNTRVPAAPKRVLGN